MVNLVQGAYCREFLIDKSIDYKLDCLIGPLLEGLFEREIIETTGDYVACRPVAGELCLQGIDRRGLCWVGLSALLNDRNMRVRT